MRANCAVGRSPLPAAPRTNAKPRRSPPRSRVAKASARACSKRFCCCGRSRMFAEVDVLGAFVPGIAVWLFGSLVIFIILDVLLTKVGFYRVFWHPALARV